MAQVIDLTKDGQPRLVPSTAVRGPGYPSFVSRLNTDRGQVMMQDRPGGAPPAPALPPAGTGTTVPLLPKNPLQGAAVPGLKAGIDNLNNDYAITSEVAQSTQGRVDGQKTAAGRAGAATGGALLTVPALMADQAVGIAKGAYTAATPVLKVAETVGGAALDFGKGLLGIEGGIKADPSKSVGATGTWESAPPKPTPAVPATPAAPAKLTGPTSGSIPSAAPPALPAGGAAANDPNLYAAGMKYAEDLKRINQRLIDTGTVTGGPMPALSSPAAGPAAPATANPFAGSTNGWDKLWAAQWDAAAKKNAQQVGIQQQNASTNTFNAETQRKQVDMMPGLQAGQQASAQKIAGMNVGASVYGADKQLEGVKLTNANRTAIEAAKLAQRQAEAKGTVAPPTAVPMVDGIAVVGQGGVVEYHTLDKLKADGAIRAQARAAVDGQPITDTSGAVLGVKVTTNGVPGVRLSNGKVIPLPDPQGRAGGGPLPTMGDTGL